MIEGVQSPYDLGKACDYMVNLLEATTKLFVGIHSNDWRGDTRAWHK
jgi:hypothetical protein